MNNVTSKMNTELQQENDLSLNSSLRSKLLGVSFDSLTLKQALENIELSLGQPKKSNLFFVNAHCLNVAYINDNYREALKKADLVLPDGIGVKLGCKLKQAKIRDNLNGTDLFPYICKLAENKKSRVFLLGARPQTAEKVADWMTEKHPNIQVVGCHHGHFSEEQNSSIIESINKSRADILIVAMGVPRQELWIDDNQAKLNSTLNIAVGGLFEFYSNNISRAPLWVRSCSLEWIWRLKEEPKRLAKRYLVESLLFLKRVSVESLLDKKVKSAPIKLANDYHWVALRYRVKLRKQKFIFSRWWHKKSIRFFDLALSLSSLIMLLPFLPLLAIVIRIDSPGSLFFTQKRVGEHGRPFDIIKFRSMHLDAEERLAELQHLNEKQGGIMFKIKDDPRITRVGKIIRKLSIDELPQIWNVVRGEMSIVGPRPALYKEVEQYNILQRERLEMKPGLTSEWVIKGRNDLTFKQQAELDIEHYYRHSVWQNLKIVIKTIPALLSGRGAS